MAAIQSTPGACSRVPLCKPGVAKSSQVKSSQVKHTLLSDIEKLHCGLLERIQVHTVHVGRNKTTI